MRWTIQYPIRIRTLHAFTFKSGNKIVIIKKNIPYIYWRTCHILNNILKRQLKLKLIAGFKFEMFIMFLIVIYPSYKYIKKIFFKIKLLFLHVYLMIKILIKLTLIKSTLK